MFICIYILNVQIFQFCSKPHDLDLSRDLGYHFGIWALNSLIWLTFSVFRLK